MNPDHLETLCQFFELGNLIKPPTRVAGGLSHIMWKITTDIGCYAVKQLSQNIDMIDKSVRRNYELTEDIAHWFYEKGLATVYAIENKGKRLLEVNGVGFLIYPWVESQPIPKSESVCIEIAHILAKIHLIDLQVPEILEPFFPVYNNDRIIELIEKSKNFKAPFAELLYNCKDKIITINANYRASIPILKEQVVVSHGDLDQKNVLWNRDKVILIDWEAARKLNPTYEIINASLDWSGITTDNFDQKLFYKMIKAYQDAGGKINKNHVYAAFAAALGNWINWMMYNIMRACVKENSEEKDLGIEQVNMVLPTIIRLMKARDFLKIGIHK